MSEREYRERISQYHEIEYNQLHPELPLKGLHIELSNVCNHQCLFCANRKMTRKKGFMDETFLKRILREAYSEGFEDVGFYANGEPFVSKNLCQYIMWAKEVGYKYIYIDTNGGATNFDGIQKAIDAGLDSIKFSINGTDPKSYHLIHGKDDYAKVMDNLKKTHQYREKLGINLKIYVSVAVTKFIENNLSQFISEIEPFCDDIVTNNVIEMGGYISEELRELSTNTKADFVHGMQIPCYMLWNGFYITYEGYATACCADFQNYFVYADLNKTSIKDAWNNDRICDLRKKHLEKNIEDLPCVSCVYGMRTKWIPVAEDYYTAVEEKTLRGFDLEERIKAFKN